MDNILLLDLILKHKYNFPRLVRRIIFTKVYKNILLDYTKEPFVFIYNEKLDIFLKYSGWQLLETIGHYVHDDIPYPKFFLTHTCVKCKQPTKTMCLYCLKPMCRGHKRFIQPVLLDTVYRNVLSVVVDNPICLHIL